MKKCSDCKADEPCIKHKMQRLAIVGNMSVGKSTLFSRMCTEKTSVIKIPGNSVSIISGKIRGINAQAYDTHSIYSIFSSDEEERAARDILIPLEENSDTWGIIVTADAKNMKRSIAIALQFAEYGLPMLLNINMIDEATSRGININTEELSEILGIDVCTTVARDGIGVRKVVSRISNMQIPDSLIEYPDWVMNYLEFANKLLPPSIISSRIIGLLLLAGDTGIEKHIEDKISSDLLEQLKNIAEEYRQNEPLPIGIILTSLYNKRAENIVNSIQTIQKPLKRPFLNKLGDWCTKLSTGIPIALIVLYLMYLFIGTFGATFVVDTVNMKVFEGFLLPLTEKIVDPIPNKFFRDMLIDPEFGILPTGVFIALGLVLPVLFCFYIAFGFLEGSGYLPRLSILLDKLLQKMGLNGKGVIPLIMGFSCVTMAILTTRMLDSKKEKNIASFLLLLGMPCAPLLAVMFIILGKMHITASITVFGLIFLQILVAGFLANKILPGERTPLLMEIPPMRIPQFFQIIKLSAIKTYFFMKEAVPVFIIASLFVFLFERMGGLDILEKIAKPVVNGFMGLPEKSVQVFIKTIIRRESGATEIEHLSSNYDNVQLVVNLLVMTFLSPCMNATIVLFKERGTRTAVVIIVTVMIYAIIIGSVVNHTCRFLGITFS